jgi:hypothetical protein
MDYGLLSHIDSRELSLVHHVFRAKVATLFIGLNALVTRPYIFFLKFYTNDHLFSNFKIHAQCTQHQLT